VSVCSVRSALPPLAAEVAIASPSCCGTLFSLPPSAVPTLWARSRAVSESGGGRLPRHSPLGGGRASYEGAQQPQGLELASISPHTQLLMF